MDPHHDRPNHKYGSEPYYKFFVKDGKSYNEVDNAKLEYTIETNPKKNKYFFKEDS